MVDTTNPEDFYRLFTATFDDFRFKFRIGLDDNRLCINAENNGMEMKDIGDDKKLCLPAVRLVEREPEYIRKLLRGINSWKTNRDYFSLYSTIEDFYKIAIDPKDQLYFEYWFVGVDAIGTSDKSFIEFQYRFMADIDCTGRPRAYSEGNDFFDMDHLSSDINRKRFRERCNRYL